MSPPELTETDAIRVKDSKYSPQNVQDCCNFSNLEELIFYEEKHVLNLLSVTLKTAPILLGNDGLKKSKNSGDI